MIRQNTIKKGDVLVVARIAAVQAVKKTSDLIPLAHGGVPVEGCVVRVEPVGLSNSDTQPKPPTFSSEEQRIEEISQLSEPIGLYGGVRISVQVETTAKTGVEMEALTGVMGAALTVVDMCKSVDKGCVIDDVRVVGKKGGRSGGLGIWRKGPDKISDDSKRMGGILKKTEWARENKLTQLLEKALDKALEKAEKEAKILEEPTTENPRIGRYWKKWTPDQGSDHRYLKFAEHVRQMSLKRRNVVG